MRHWKLISEKDIGFNIRKRALDISRSTFPFHMLSREQKIYLASRVRSSLASWLSIFSHGVFFLNILCRIRRGRGQDTMSWLAASAAAARGSVSVSLFAFCLPAEHRGVQESRGAIERRRLIAVERRTENRAPCYDSFPPRGCISPPFYSASGQWYEKG